MLAWVLVWGLYTFKVRGTLVAVFELLFLSLMAGVVLTGLMRALFGRRAIGLKPRPLPRDEVEDERAVERGTDPEWEAEARKAGNIE